MTTTSRRPLRFFVGFGIAALLIAGLLSYFADSDPDGLDTVTQHGCRQAGDTEELRGSCIAQRAEDHALADTPLADYTVGGDDGLTGLAGVAGVVATLVVAGGIFWVLRRRRTPSSDDDSG